VAVASAGPYASLHPDRKPRQQPTTQFLTGWMPFLPSNQQRQSTEGQQTEKCKTNQLQVCIIDTMQHPLEHNINAITGP